MVSRTVLSEKEREIEREREKLKIRDKTHYKGQGEDSLSLLHYFNRNDFI